MKTGARHLAGLGDGRVVFINGERVDDVRSIPLSSGHSHRSAGAAAPENRDLMTFATPEIGTK
jgi:hypothetical protein